MVEPVLTAECRVFTSWIQSLENLLGRVSLSASVIIMPDHHCICRKQPLKLLSCSLCVCGYMGIYIMWCRCTERRVHFHSQCLAEKWIGFFLRGPLLRWQASSLRYSGRWRCSIDLVKEVHEFLKIYFVVRFSSGNLYHSYALIK